MIGYLVRELRHRLGRTSVLGAGILVAAVSFCLLTSAATTSAARVQGTVERSFGSAYDLLVRPAGSRTPFERSEELVRPNFLSGIFGGITLDQYQQVKELNRVEVAAPVAMIGYTMPFAEVPIDLTHFVNERQRQVFRVSLNWSSDRGLSTYRGGDLYVYVTPNRFSTIDTANAQGVLVEKARGRNYQIGQSFGPLADTARPPFAPASRDSLSRWSLASPAVSREYLGNDFPQGHVGAKFDLSFPMLVAAIDPDAEARLDHLDRALVDGRYLRRQEQPKVIDGIRTVPVLAADRAFVDYAPTATIQRLHLEQPARLPERLSGYGAWKHFHNLDAVTVGHRQFSLQRAYETLLNDEMTKPPFFTAHAFWRTGPVRYRARTNGSLRALTTSNPDTVWRCTGCGGGGYVAPPFTSSDTQFRRLDESVGSMQIVRGVLDEAGLRTVGRFDADQLPGFSPLSQVPLGTFQPPTVAPADDRSRRLLGGRTLLSNGDVGGYVAQPPLMLMTLDSLPAFTNSQYYTETNRDAPISVIRVRVHGVDGPDPTSLARLRAVAQQIATTTGLEVDITAGSSPSPQEVVLPPGHHGRPELTLTEGWVKKGVAVAIVQAVDEKSLVLFALILLATGCFLANGALATVRARRQEIGTLLCLGWSRSRIFAVVLGELAAVGLVAGAVGAGIAFVLVRLLSLHLAVWYAALITPVAVLLAVLAGVVPAYAATRGSPLDTVNPAVVDVDRARSPRSLSGLAWLGLRRRPGRLVLSAVPLFIGVAALAVLLTIDLVFDGTLAGSLLGNAVVSRTRGVDYLTVALVIMLAAASVVDTMLLTMREQASELATLKAGGWSGPHVTRYIASQGLILGVLGAVAGIVVGLVFAVIFGAASGSVTLPLGIGAAAGVLVAAGAALGPAVIAARRPLARTLAEE